MPGSGRSDPLGGRHPAIVDAARLHRSRHRRQRGQTLIEGPRLLDEALRSGVEVRSVFAGTSDTATLDLCDRQGIDAMVVSDAALIRLADTETPRGPVAVIDIPRTALPLQGDILVAHGVSEPGNMGALIRTAAAFGWEFGYTTGSADPWAPKTLRAGAGGHFRTPVARIDGLAGLKGLTTVSTVVAGGVAPEVVKGDRFAVLIGEEASGIPDDVTDSCDVKVTIPMPGGTESLNAGVAAGIVVYVLSRRRFG
jgi:RNA methyltransferase, TrmH family